MFEYGHLKYVEVREGEFCWFFITTKDGNRVDEQLKVEELLLVLNELGSKSWELVAIEPTIGFILKRSVDQCRR